MGLYSAMKRNRKLRARVMRVVNPILLQVSGRRFFPLFCRLEHIGRRSGRTYVTPLGAHPVAGGLALPLAYGAHTDWCRNVMAAGRCSVVWRGHRYEMEAPEIVPAAEVFPEGAPGGIPQYLRLAWHGDGRTGSEATSHRLGSPVNPA